LTLLSAWALGGLVLLVPLVALHLRGRRLPRSETASLIGWSSLDAAPAQRRRRLRPPPLSLLLALQALAVILLVVSLARPVRSTSGGPAVRVFVLDDSIWMQARDGGGTRFDVARRTLDARLAALPSDAAVRIVSAAATPSLRFAGSADEASDALARIPVSDSAANLGAAIQLAAGLRIRPSDPIVLLHAPENAVPDVTGGGGGASGAAGGAGAAGGGGAAAGGGGAAAGGGGAAAGGGGAAAGGAAAGGGGAAGGASAAAGGVFSATAVGSRFDDRSIGAVSTRCGLPDGGCEVLSRVASTGGEPVAARVEVVDGERVASSTRVTVPAGGSAPVVFRAPAGARLTLRLAGSDALPADDRAYAVIPSAGGATGATVRVTVVGAGTGIVPLVGALAAQPGVEVRLRTPATFRAADARASDLLVLDGALPRGPLPAAPALLLVDPPRLPGGSVAGHLADARVAGVDQSSPLLAGVDLTSLALDPTSVRRVRLPRWMTPVAWARGGPLLASGVDRGQRVALLSFEPSDSTLPELPGFPLLVANLLGWSQSWLPAQAPAGSPVTVEQPPGTVQTTLATSGRGGQPTTRMLPRAARTVALTPAAGIAVATQRRTGALDRTRALAVEPDATPSPPGAPIDIAAPTSAAAAPSPRQSLAPWLLAAAFAVVLAESALVLRRRRSLVTLEAE
jgi:hypothetical protein